MLFTAMTRRLARGLFAVLSLVLPVCAAAQSTSATVFDVVIDEQRAVLQGVEITLENLDTGDTRGTASDALSGRLQPVRLAHRFQIGLPVRHERERRRIIPDQEDEKPLSIGRHIPRPIRL